MLTIVNSLGEIYFDKIIDNLLVQLVVATSNQIRTFIFHSLLDYNFCFNV